MFGLGKRRTKFGRWIDRKGIAQIEIEEKAKLGRATISRLCNDFDYRPKFETVQKVKRAIKALGHDVPPDDYFGM
ncbi:helix-turn-helix domain-containing protein [Cytobacillus massiliigabonensis]|uniref:helix-turn-helix domain-containing protein n=1 Tax=Cytobacillus massiliigabonensis TaxID=1871011 RepID=UPI000C83A60E|nr:helix-turn-helix transcriptional regulator [Cytobacillus massiliigabonensis]